MPNGITLLGLVALAALWLAGRNMPGGLITDQTAPMTPDCWTTPFYLRSNVAVPSMQMAILPTQTTDSWSLATGVQG